MLKTGDIRQVQATEMRIIWMVCGKLLLDKIAHSILREWAGLEDIDEHFRGH